MMPHPLHESSSMSRYRPPQPKASPYITAPGYRALQEELKALWVRRAEVTAAVTAAAAEGDRSENAEYIYRKKELRGIDRRIGYLQKRLPILKVVDSIPDDRDRVFFGAWVTLEDTSGKETVYRIVGPDEFDHQRGWISMDSPMAHALLRRSLDDEIGVQAPAGEARYIIVDIRYEGDTTE